MMTEICEICGREGPSDYFELHHLFPGKKKSKKNVNDKTITVDHTCGDQIHLMFDNTQLREKYNTAEALRGAMQTYIAWVRKKPLEANVQMKAKKRKR